uniref:Uncharacterized protein n=1 Tax=Sphaerodactylus townsendi TaxID=933632 RepID=A0ACB8F0T8_9SAUR
MGLQALPLRHPRRHVVEGCGHRLLPLQRRQRQLRQILAIPLCCLSAGQEEFHVARGKCISCRVLYRSARPRRLRSGPRPCLDLDPQPTGTSCGSSRLSQRGDPPAAPSLPAMDPVRVKLGDSA